MLDNQSLVDILNRNLHHGVSPDEQFYVINQYIKERKDVDYNPKSMHLSQLSEAFQYAMMWYMKDRNIFVCRDVTNRIIKFYV